MCRRVCYDDGSAKMWGDTDMANFTELEAGNDSGIELLFTFDTDKKLTVDMPLRKVTIAEKDAAIRAIEDFKKELGDGVITFNDNAKMHVYAGTVARYEAQQTVDIIPIEVHVLKLGNIAFATNPYELFLDYGNRIRARSKASQTFLIQLSCGSWGYLPTEKAERGSHYSAYVSSGTVGHTGGDLLVRKTLSEINEMWK